MSAAFLIVEEIKRKFKINQRIYKAKVRKSLTQKQIRNVLVCFCPNDILSTIMNKKKKICIATGGTGGHIYPALALAQIWTEMEPDTEIVFIGNDDRMEAQIVPSFGYRFLPVHASGLTGGILHKIQAVNLMFKARKQAKQYMKEENPDLFIGFGGYVCAPGALAAHDSHIPIMLHEQNSVVGKANKLVSHYASGIVTCYQKAQDYFGDEKARMLGNPRASLAARAQADLDYFISLGLDPNMKTIMVVMGSLGSSSVNELMEKALGQVDPSLQILYVCGKDNQEDLHRFDAFPNVHSTPYVDALRLYGLLDGMVCRAGATTLCELTALGIPAVIIPSPYVAENHQFYNAKMLVDQNAAVMLEEKDLNATTLSKAIQEAFLNEEKRMALKANAYQLGTRQAAQNMIAFANEIIHKASSQEKKR